MGYSKYSKKIKKMTKKIDKQEKEINELRSLLYDNIQNTKLLRYEKPPKQIGFLRGEDESYD